MQVFKNHAIFDEIVYDRPRLIQWYRSVEHLRCDFGVFQNRLWLQGQGQDRRDKTRTIHFNLGQFDTIDTLTTLGHHLTAYPEIQELVNYFNFDPPIKPHHVDMVIYRPNWHFHPHTDHSMNCGIMFPLLPDQGASPIDFYHMPPNETWHRARDYRRSIDPQRDLDYSYHYSLEHPSLFNGRVIHGVKNNDATRVFIRIKCLGQTFEDIVARTQQGLFVKPQGRDGTGV